MPVIASDRQNRAIIGTQSNGVLSSGTLESVQ